MQEIVSREVETVLKMSTFEFPNASPATIVSRKDGSHRSSVQYRKLTTITKSDAECIPDEKHLFTLLNKAKLLSQLDLTKGQWQVLIASKKHA